MVKLTWESRAVFCLGRICKMTPPFGSFTKIHPFWCGNPSLSVCVFKTYIYPFGVWALVIYKLTYLSCCALVTFARGANMPAAGQKFLATGISKMEDMRYFWRLPNNLRWCLEHTSYLLFFLHMQNFWRKKSTSKFIQ